VRNALTPVLLFAERAAELPPRWADHRTVRAAGDFLVQKDLLRPEEFARLTTRARQAAFTVAGMTRKTALKVVRNELGKQIKLQATPDEAARAVNQRLIDAGYSALNPSHADLVARQAFASSYGAATWEALHQDRIKGIIPFFRYMTRNDNRVRPGHRPLHGKMYARDDAKWNHLWPPLDFGCRCYIVGVPVNQVRTYGLRPSRVVPDGVEIAYGFGGNPVTVMKRWAGRR
jgi:SPP1 gp7 family putative phage head morphogenesis protein